MAQTSNGNTQRFRSIIDDEKHEVVLSGDRVTINGIERSVSLERVRDRHYSLLIDGRSYSMILDSNDPGRVDVSINGHLVRIRVMDQQALLLEELGMQQTVDDGVGEIHAPMPGLVVRLLVEEGDEVAAGQGLLVLEAMKMENELHATADGRIAKIHAAPGDAVTKNALLIEIDVQPTASS